MFGHFGVVPPTPKAIDGDVWQLVVFPRVGLYRTILRPMCVKQCHTPSMTGNRNHTTYKNADDWFMKLFYSHYTAKVEWEEVHLKSIAMHEPCRHQPVSFRFPDLTL